MEYGGSSADAGQAAFSAAERYAARRKGALKTYNASLFFIPLLLCGHLRYSVVFGRRRFLLCPTFVHLYSSL